MADETARRDTASNPQSPAAAKSTPAQEPEATILEETVIRPAPKAPAPRPAPLPQPPTPPPPAPASPVPQKEETAPIFIPPKIPITPLETTSPSAPPAPIPTAEKKEPPMIALDSLDPVPSKTPIPKPAEQHPHGLNSAALAAGILPEMPFAPAPVRPAPPAAPKPAPTIAPRQEPPMPAAAPARAEPMPPAPAPAVIPAAERARESVFVPQSGAVQKPPELAKILEEVKLPDRSQPSSIAPQKVEEARTFDTTLGASVPPASAPAPEPKRDLSSSIVSPLRTLKDDLQVIVREKKISLVRAAALEQEKRYGRSAEKIEEQVATHRSRRTANIIFAAALLTVLGVGAFFGVYIISQQRGGAPSTEAPSLLFSETTVSLPLDNQNALDLKRLIASARGASSATLGSITRIVPTKTATDEEGVPYERAATLEEFLGALGTRAPADLVRALSSDFFFGIHTVDENAPLLVIPVLSYERAFAGMLAWEQTLNADLSPAFTPVPEQVLGAGGLPQKRTFSDVVMRNYDVRALKDDGGTIELYYSFPTQGILIIGESPYSFTEILSRLRAVRRL